MLPAVVIIYLLRSCLSLFFSFASIFNIVIKLHVSTIIAQIDANLQELQAAVMISNNWFSGFFY
jgi:hypothetical protein